MRFFQQLFGSRKFRIMNGCLGLFVVVVVARSFNVLHFQSLPKIKDIRKYVAQQSDTESNSVPSGWKETFHKTEDRVNGEDYDMDYMPYLFKRNPNPGFKFGGGRQHPVKVAIGIPHVKRPSGDSYLNKTLDSLTMRIFASNEESMTIVVFIAEKDDHAYVENQAKYLYERYKREFDSGIIQVIGPPKDFYPNFGRLIPNLGDSSKRVWWRSKEVIDAALLMLYCEKLADHYLMLEDDVIAAKGYMGEIIDYLDEHSSDDYLMITAAGKQYGSIGKIFKRKSIPVWVSSLLSFYNQKPVDWLLDDTTRLLACSGISGAPCRAEIERRVPEMPSPLFLHVGYSSSLAGKTFVRDSYNEKIFGNVGSTNKHQNPPVNIHATAESNYMMDNVERWYDDSGGLTEEFCLYDVKRQGSIEFHFHTVQSVKLILLKTGSFKSSSDLRMCEGCAALETTENPPEQSDYNECALSDKAGSMECRFVVYKPLMAFRITLKKPFVKRTCFSVVYVQVNDNSIKLPQKPLKLESLTRGRR